MQIPIMARGISTCDQSGIMSAPDKDDPPKPSGRVRHDSGGRAVWEWAIESGRHAIDSTSALLKKLELTGLRLMDDKEKEAAREADEEASRLADPQADIPTFGGDRAADPHRGKRGFNPYNSRVAAERKAGKPKLPPKPRITQPARPAKKPGFFARLFGKGKT